MIKMKKKIIWLIPFIVLITTLIFKINIYLIVCFTLLSILCCFLIKPKKEKSFFKIVNKSHIHREKSGILIGKKQENVYLTDETKVLIIDKKAPNDYLNSNIRTISNYIHKPNMIIIDPNRELYNENYDYLKKLKYNITSYNLSNTFIDVFKIITKKMYAIKDLELKVNNIKGQYILVDETYLSYEDIRKKIKEYKDDIKKMIKEFLICFFYSLYDFEFLPLYYILLLYIEKKIYQEKIVELTFKNVITFINEKSSESIIKIKKYLNSNIDEEFLSKEELKMLKLNKYELEKSFKNISKKADLINEKVKTMKTIDLEGFYTSNEIIFLEGENEESLKLFLFLLNYTHLEIDLYLLLSSNAFYEFTLDKLKVIHVITELKDVSGLDKYSVKLYRSKVINKKEVLRLCKKELDKEEINYNKMFDFLKLIDKIDSGKDEVLVINPKKGNVIINCDFSQDEKRLLKEIKNVI